MGTNITKLVEEILLKAQETQEEFIFETIRPYCENVLQMKINKEELKHILLNGSQVKTAQWVEQKVIDSEDEGQEPIEVWQSAKCNNCNRYHTTPYMYYFTDYNYCPHCGYSMTRGDTDDT